MHCGMNGWVGEMAKGADRDRQTDRQAIKRGGLDYNNLTVITITSCYTAPQYYQHFLISIRLLWHYACNGMSKTVQLFHL